MSKERLEEIEVKYSTLTVSSERDGIEYTEIDINDLVYLMQNNLKQTKRVQELESEIENWQKGRFLAVSTFVKEIDLKKRVQELEKQNKRYREALEEIYGLAEYDEYDNTLEQIVSEVEKALEE